MSTRTTAELPDANLQPCHVGVVFAMALEAAALEARMNGVISIQAANFSGRQGGLKGRGVVVVHSGAGRRNAEDATAALILGHKPAWVISAGLAGGLNSKMQRGDVLMPDAVCGEDGRRLAIDLRISAAERTSHPNLHVGPLLTIDRVAYKASDKKLLGERHGALAVDMETLAVAEECQRQKQKFLAVRVVLDPVNEELPADFERLLTRKTLVRKIGAAAGSILHRPSIVKDMWHFRGVAHDCSERLAKFLEGVIAQL